MNQPDDNLAIVQRFAHRRGVRRRVTIRSGILGLVALASLGCDRDPAPRGDVRSPPPARQLHPHFPVVEGTCAIADGWTVHLPGRFNRRIEDGSVVIWRPGLTIWAHVEANPRSESREARLAELASDADPRAQDVLLEEDGGLLRFAYRLAEGRVDDRRPGFYREKTELVGDSGWRFFAGDEPQSYIDEPANSGVYEISAAAGFDPDIVPLLRTPAPCAFEKVPGERAYRRVRR